ncbi:TIGR03503 family protein [Psychrosphaera sp.]|nr:TIGR03503 family protein [Psychrosphaera sp.]
MANNSALRKALNIKLTTSIFKSILTVFAFTFLLPIASANALPGTSLPKIIDPTKAQAQPTLEMLKNFKGSNQIKLLNNRFRIDYEVDELLLLLFRKRGSSPVVLVKPDGSKIYVTAAETGEVDWHADVSYDLIRLKNPMPGPWQALGRIEDTSKILVLSDVQLIVDPLPSSVFQTERIKAKAKITNARELIRDPAIRDVVRLRAYLYSTNNAELKNFGAGIYTLGEFFDDGRVLDERPRDGEFTVQYDFNSEVGKWTPKYRAQAELFTREVVQADINVLPAPITFTVEKATGEDNYHYVTIEVDDRYVDINELVFQGVSTFPNGDTETFHLNKDQERKISLFQADYGQFQIETEVFGKDKEGREFILSPPVFAFTTEIPETLSDIKTENGEELTENPIETAQNEEQQLNEVEIKEEPVPIALIIILNLVILTVGFLVIWLIVLKRSIPNPLKLIKFKKKSKDGEKNDSSDKEKASDKAPKQEGSDDILDLSLPDD